MIREKFDISAPRSREGDRRLDFFCLGDRYQTAFVVETKRPGKLVGQDEFDQIRNYVLYLRTVLQQGSTISDYNRATVRGLLIADRIRPGEELHAKAGQDAGIFDIRTWGNLLRGAEAMHKEFLDVITMRAPAGDPRIPE